MKFLKPLLFTLFCLVFGNVQAQDVPHFSLFDYAPLSTNPALTGAYSGSFRLGGLFRDQGFSFLPNEIVTYAFYIDAPIIRGFRKNDWIGVGLNLFQDKAGAAALKTGGGMFSAAYHLAMNKKATSVLTFGLQGGSVSKKIDLTNVKFEDQKRDPSLSQSADQNIIGGEDANKNYLNFNAGILLTTQMSKQSKLQLGLAVKNILSPDYHFLSNSQQQNSTDSIANELPLRVTFHGNMAFDLNKKWTLAPAFIVNQITSLNEMALQAWLDYKLNPEKEMKLRFGAGYRIGDAAEVLLGMDIKDFRFGLAYDVTTSQLSAANKSVGGIELAASYIIKIYKEPTIEPVIICPKF